MAVLKGIEITVRVYGQALQEYEDISEDDDQNSRNQRDYDGMPYRMTKYIEATSGARFIINAVVPKSGRALLGALRFALSLDGLQVRTSHSFMSMRLRNLKNGIWSFSIDGSDKVTRSETCKRPFMFSNIQWSEDAFTPSQRKQQKSSADDLGTIVLKVWRVKLRRGTGQGKKFTSFEGPLYNAGDVNEKELKGKNVTHRVCLGEEEQPRERHQASWWWKADYVDGFDHPFAVFTFKYCSKRALQSLLLIPRTPSPAPAPPPVPLEERPFDELTIEELRELARRQQARFQVERVKLEAGIKAENGIKSEPGIKYERGVKRERDEEVEELLVLSSAKKVKRPIANGEIVDLSD